MDDEPFNIIGLLTVISNIGYNFILQRTDRAYNGREAINKCDELITKSKHLCSYGLIFMDLSMPFVDGYQATREIRKLYATYSIEQPRIVICTGHVESEFI